MTVSTQDFLQTASDAGFNNIPSWLVGHWVGLGLLDIPERVPSVEGDELITIDLWPDEQRDLFLQLVIFRSSVDNVEALASLPVAAWLYWNDNDVPTRQIQVALRTFWSRGRRLQGTNKSKIEAWTIIQAVLGEEGAKVPREHLYRQIVRILQHHDTISKLTPMYVENVVATLPKQSNGPQRATIDIVVDMVTQLTLAVANYDTLTGENFEEARDRQRNFVLEHAGNDSGIENTESADWLDAIDYTFLVQNACRDLMVGLGRLISSKQRDVSLPQFEPTIWKGLSAELFGPSV